MMSSDYSGLVTTAHDVVAALMFFNKRTHSAAVFCSESTNTQQPGGQ